MAHSLDEKFKRFFSLHRNTRHFGGAEIHWFFVEADTALQHGLFISACLAYINGIEASIRTTLMYAEGRFDQRHMSRFPIMKNDLLAAAQHTGMNVSLLAFPDEQDFEQKLHLKGWENAVKLVQVRNNLCHGNVFEYFEVVPESEDVIFTPDCLRSLAFILKDISQAWGTELERFRGENAL